MKKDKLKKIHEQSGLNKDSVLKSETVGCFHCLEIYSAKEINQFAVMFASICSKCGVDSVIASEDVEVTKELLLDMHKMYFPQIYQRSLKHIIKETIWMARRYADGRRTYAVGMVNDSLDLCDKLGIEIQDDHTLYDSKSRATDGQVLDDKGINPWQRTIKDDESE